ncbi:hypothetical protein ABII15_37085 [Streptomyces sp. HUAS MG91]|uniref:Transposase n=1 Tax=Streptomyces tabacisoli TaxID=3156398 RepID=A0AAU8J5C5_9ACTN
MIKAIELRAVLFALFAVIPYSQALKFPRAGQYRKDKRQTRKNGLGDILGVLRISAPLARAALYLGVQVL